MTTPILILDELSDPQSQPSVPINRTSRALEAAVQLTVISDSVSTPPVSPSEGDRYIVGAAATGVWAGHTDHIAYYSGGWKFLYPKVGWLAYVQSAGAFYQYSMGSPQDWIPFTGGRLSFQIPCSDMTTDLAVGTSKGYLRAPRAFTLTEVRASLLVSPASSGVTTIDINKNGSTILSTKLTVDSGEKTSETAAVPAVISNGVIADDDEITVDIDGVHSSGVKGLIVTLIGE